MCEAKGSELGARLTLQFTDPASCKLLFHFYSIRLERELVGNPARRPDAPATYKPSLRFGSNNTSETRGRASEMDGTS